MLPETHFQQLLLPRFGKARERVQEMVWTVHPEPLPVARRPPSKQHAAFDEAQAGPFKPIKKTPHHWGRMFDQCWWKLTLPAGKRGEKRYLRWVDQGEATLYLDGVPHYGIDPGHHFAPLPSSAKGDVFIESLCARTGVWVEGEAQGIDASKGSRFDGAFLASRNDDAWHTLHDLDALLQVIELLHRPEYPAGADLWGRGAYRPEVAVAEPLFRRLVDRVNSAIDALDRDGLPACRKQLQKTFAEFPAYPDAMKAVLTGHAHIDLVWLWPERAGEFKAVHSFANALRLMEQYPEMTFGYSQPASYEAVQRRSPKLMRRVKQQIKTGGWEPTGALYVESDVQLPCGEALVRAFELGQKGFRELRGDDSRCVWIPDVFGYSACLPTIMAGFGVPYFYTTKLHWSGATRFPYSSFKWVGMDGSEVVSHISWNHYNQRVTADELRLATDQHRQSHVHDEALVACGYGDGGGGVAEAMCERARRFADLASMPRAEWGTIEGFFDRLAEKKRRLPIWRGEMYLEYHRGVQTTHGDLKSAFRAAERGLQVWEAVRCATGGGPVDEQMWKRVCFAQFHDYIPGSSIAEVYEEHVPELEGIAAEALRRATDELNATAGQKAGGSSACVFNPLPVERVELVNGKVLRLPPLAGVRVKDAEVVPAAGVEADAKRLRNGRVEASFNAAGELRSLRVDGESVALGEPAAQLWTFDDLPAAYDAWDIDRYTLSQGARHAGRAAGIADVDKNGTSATVSFTKSLGRVGSVTTRYRLDAGSAVLRIDLDFDLKQPQVLVKLVFPTLYRGREARYGGPFGSVKRPQWSGPLTNDAMFEVPGSRWACVADDDERDGLMLITESKYGFGCHEGTLHLSLARSAMVTQSNAGGDTTSIGTAGDDRAFADLGRQRVSLAVGRFSASAPQEAQPAVLADTLFTPVLRYRGRPCDAGLQGMTGPPSLVPAWAKPGTKRSWTLRLHETLGSRGHADFALSESVESVATVDLRGSNWSGLSKRMHVKPYGLFSLQVER